MRKYVSYKGQLYKAVDLSEGGFEKLKTLVMKKAEALAKASPVVKKTADGVSFKVVREGGDGKTIERDSLQVVLGVKTDATKTACKALENALDDVVEKLKSFMAKPGHFIDNKPMFDNVRVSRINGTIKPGTNTLTLVSFITKAGMTEQASRNAVYRDEHKIEEAGGAIENFSWNIHELDVRNIKKVGSYDSSLAQDLAKLGAQIKNMKVRLKAVIQKYNSEFPNLRKLRP